MALQTVFTNRTTDGLSTVYDVSGPCTVSVSGNSTFGGAEVYVETSNSSTAGEFKLPDNGAVLKAPGDVYIGFTGDYKVRVRVLGAGWDTILAKVEINN